MKNLFILLATFVIAHTSYPQADPSQKPKYIKHLDISSEGGPMLGNGTDLGEQIKNSSRYFGVDVRLGFQRGNESIYSRAYRYPTMGVGFYSSTFHNANVGEPNAVYFFMDIPMSYSHEKDWMFSYFFSYGLSYNFNPYHPEDNPINLFIGSYRNVYVHLGLKAARRLTSRVELNATLGFKHFSNGASSLPNSGINLIPLSLGMGYRLTKSHNKDFTPTPLPEHKPKTAIHFHLAPGVKEYFIGDNKNLKLGAGLHVLQEISHMHRLGVGLDYFYAANSRERIADTNNTRFWDANSFALFASWEWLLTENLYAPMGVGIYLNRNLHNGEENWYYQRLGLRYRFNNNVFAGVSIKAHKARADFFEWTVGYSLFR